MGIVLAREREVEKHLDDSQTDPGTGTAPTGAAEVLLGEGSQRPTEAPLQAGPIKTNWDERSSQWTPRAVSRQPHPHGLSQCSPSGPRPCAAGMLPSGFLQPEAQPCLLLGYMGHPGTGQKTAQLIISYHNRLLQRFFPLLLNHCCFNKGW